MKCEFSETQFAFCFTFEILQRYPQLQLPWFPSLRQEGRRGGGYDVVIDGSLFLQFKRPTYLQKKDKYKIQIHTGEGQFRLLKELRKNKPANLVYYVAPKFHTCKHMERFYLDKSIETNSALFFIDHFPIDGSYHKLIYEYEGDFRNGELVSTCDLDGNVQKPYGLLSSNPMRIETSPSIFSNSYTPDPMTLQKKAEFVLQRIGHPFESENPVKTLFSTLLIKYNILWIPFGSKLINL